MISTSDSFYAAAEGAVRPLDWGLNISFSKARNPDTAWFTLNQSYLDGADILGQLDTQPVQLWDYYEYESVRDRVINLNIERSIEFPYNVQSAILDTTLDNHDGALSYSQSRAGRDILPKRPVRAYLGFAGAGVVPQFVGVTQQLPKYSGVDDTQLTWTANDFLSDIGDKQLTQSIILENATTDTAIAAILDQYGLDPTMYDLEPGLNVIPFVFFDKDKNIGNALRDLVEAEGGKLWLSETGIIKFVSGASELDVEPVAYFDDSNIIEYTPSQTDSIVNHIKVKSEVRKVTAFKPVYEFTNNFYADAPHDILDDPYAVAPRGGTLTVWVDLENPVLDLDTNMTLNGTTSSNFTAKFPAGATVTSGVTAEVTAFAKSARITFTNNRTAESDYVRIYNINLYGRPAEVVDVVDIDVVDQDSIDAYGDQVLTVDNNFFGSRDNAQRFAERILEHRASYNPIIDLKVKGNPALELGDYVQLQYKTSGDYKIIGIKHRLDDKGLHTDLKLERSLALRSFVLDLSQLDNPNDRLA